MAVTVIMNNIQECRGYPFGRLQLHRMKLWVDITELEIQL
jgi:hypothetical protein